jgi:hypothetical protein
VNVWSWHEEARTPRMMQRRASSWQRTRAGQIAGTVLSASRNRSALTSSSLIRPDR